MSPEKDKKFTEDFIRKWSKAGGVAKRTLSKNERILKNQEEILKKDPRNHKIWFARGLLLCEMERFKEAVRCFDAVIKLDPTNKAVYNSKASALMHMKRPDEAAKLYKHALIRLAAELDPELRARFTEEAPVEKIISEMAEELAEWGEPSRTKVCPICGSTVLWETKICPTCDWEFLEVEYEEPIIKKEVEPERELTEEEMRERLIQKIETYRLEGFEVGPLIRTLKTQPHRAKRAVAQFEENVAEVKKFRKRLASLDTSEFESKVKQLEQLFRSPYNIFAIRNEFEKLISRIEARIAAKPKVPIEKRRVAEGLTNGLRGRVNGLGKERGIGLTNGRGRVNGMVNGRGRVNGITRGVGRVNGMVNGRGRVNGITNGMIYRFQTMRTGLVNGLTNGNGITNGLGSIRFQNEAKMRRWKLTIIPVVAFIMLTLPLLIYVEVPISAIKVDGNFDDWSGVQKIASSRDPILLPNRNIDITGVAAKDDGRFLSLYLEVDNTILWGNPQTKIPDTIHFLLDTDQDPLTGYSVRGIGCDYLIRIMGYGGKVKSARLLAFDEHAQQTNWSAWSVAGNPVAEASSGMLESQVSLNSLKAGKGQRISILAHTHSYDDYSDYSDHIISNQGGILKVDQSWSPKAEVMSGANQVILTAVAGAVGDKMILNSVTVHLQGDAEPTEIVRLRLLSNGEMIDTVNSPSTKEVTFSFKKIEIDEDSTIILTVDASFNSKSGNTLGARFAYSTDFGLESGVASLTKTFPDGMINYIDHAETAEVEIDGGFSDWSDIENDVNNESVQNQNININSFASKKVRMAFPIIRTDAFFYVSVAGRIAGGSLVPYKTPGPLTEFIHLRDRDKDTVPDDFDIMPDDFNNDGLADADTNFDYDGDGVTDYPSGPDYYLETTIPLSFPAPYGGKEVRVYIGPRTSPEITGEDYLNIYVDLDGDASGYLVGPISADYLISIKGKNSEITRINYLRYEGTGLDWNWKEIDKDVHAAIDSMRLEAYADMTGLGGDRFDVLFESSDWKKEKDIATNVSIGRSATRGSFGGYNVKFASASYTALLTERADKVYFETRGSKISWEIPRSLKVDGEGGSYVLGELIPSDLVLTDDGVHYGDVYSGLDVSIDYLVSEKMLKERIIVHNVFKRMPPQSELSLATRIDYTKGLMIQAEGEEEGYWAVLAGGLNFKNREGVVFSIASPFAVDADGKVEDCYYLYNSLERILDLRCPASWLMDASYPVVIDPTLTTYMLENDDSDQGEASEFFGWSVAVGDFDNDGYADVATGAPWSDVGSYTDAGAVYVYFGPQSGDDSSPDVMIVANNTGSHLGYAIAAGIFNDDNYWDLVVTQIDNDAYAYYGYPGWSGWETSPNVTFDLSQFKETGTENFGNSVAVGNVDYDGTPLNFDDVIFGANLSDIPGDGPNHDDGMAFVFYSVFASTEIGEDAKLEPYEDSNDGHFATSIACGKIDNDNKYDVVLGEPQNNSGSGTVHIIYGDSIGVGGTYTTDAYLENEYTGENFGFSVAVGNMDSDSYTDILVGAPSNDEYGSTDRGRAYVYQANTSGYGILDSAAPDRELAGPPNADGAEFGYSVAIGDFDGDDIGDAIVGARYNASGGTKRGAVMIFEDPLGSDNTTDYFIDGTQNNEYLGWSLAVGKFANDSALVIAAGAPYWDDSSPSESDAGRVMVIMIPEYQDAFLFIPILIALPIALIGKRKKSFKLRCLRT